MAVQDYYEPLKLVEQINNSDAFGSNTQYIETESLEGAIGTLSRQEIMIAEAKGNNAKYIVTIDNNKSLKYGTIIKRENNGQYLRIVSDERDYIPPPISTFDWKQVYAEIFTMPKEG